MLSQELAYSWCSLKVHFYGRPTLSLPSMMSSISSNLYHHQKTYAPKPHLKTQDQHSSQNDHHYNPYILPHKQKIGPTITTINKPTKVQKVINQQHETNKTQWPDASTINPKHGQAMTPMATPSYSKPNQGIHFIPHQSVRWTRYLAPTWDTETASVDSTGWALLFLLT